MDIIAAAAVALMAVKAVAYVGNHFIDSLREDARKNYKNALETKHIEYEMPGV